MFIILIVQQYIYAFIFKHFVKKKLTCSKAMKKQAILGSNLPNKNILDLFNKSDDSSVVYANAQEEFSCTNYLAGTKLSKSIFIFMMQGNIYCYNNNFDQCTLYMANMPCHCG